jgi:hypothetical protein
MCVCMYVDTDKRLREAVHPLYLAWLMAMMPVPVSVHVVVVVVVVVVVAAAVGTWVG